jgi:hypothetical protein
MVGQAVPTFFVISSFLFFRGYFLLSASDGRSKGIEKLLHFLKRLLILYLFWFIVWLPWIIKEKELLHHNMWENFGILIHGFFFSYTFHGSWFISGLLIAVTFVWFFDRYKLYLLIPIVFFFCYGFLNGWYLPELYMFLQNTFRPELSLTFIYALIWVPFGYFLAIPSVEDMYKKWKVSLLVLLYVVLYLVETITGNRQICVFSIPLLFVIFHNWDISKRGIFILLRKVSIIIYIFHFIVVGVFKHINSSLDIMNGPLYMIVVFVISFVVAYSIVRLSERKYFGWLKWAY